ncbi:DUF159 family protein [Marinicauda salina]|uniref:Abasic site processing protein n=1 Tax=Marinicauda salina TaxID=2135793 RepID=A0A2U2BUB5_9PROT|nr:SOS response-associated peptidase [Marinicauda salina]PWE17603.1 DUF159 family protein [Marinicauda salina]
MCGRYVITVSLDQMRAMFGVTDRPNLQPTWNAAPTQDLPVIRRGKEGEARLSQIRWGLVPHWSKTGPEGAKPLINARAETAADKPMFRAAMARRRALVPADGFYEWSKEGDRKQPWYITRADGEPMVFAGLWERWGEGSERVDSFAILTTDASADIKAIHHRAPVILESGAWSDWLDPDIDPQPFLHPAADGALAARRISTRVNSVRNDGPELIEAEVN